MASDTIIIECNRQIALKAQLDTLGGINNLSLQHNIPNNRWQTTIQSGIQVNVGDEISLEATMINTKGTPDQTIEFVGDLNTLNPADLVDNETKMKTSFYVNNNRQFNFSLPLASHKCVTEFIYVDDSNYGLPDMESFANFKLNYPYEALEGWKWTEADKYKTGAEIAGAPATNPPPQLTNQNTLRLYCNKGFYPGGSIETTDPGHFTPCIERQQTIDLKVPIGFNTPSSVSNRLTSQLQGSSGTAIQGGYEQITPYRFVVEGTALNKYHVPGITGPTQIAIPTSTGQLGYAREAGNWSAKFVGETGGEGSGYVKEQGEKLFWDNLLCGNQAEFIAKTKVWNHTHKYAVESAAVTKENYGDHAMVKISFFEICVADQIGGEPGPDVVVMNGPNVADVVTITAANVITPPNNFLIHTNLLYTDENIYNIGQFYRASEYLVIPNAKVETTFPTSSNTAQYYQIDMPFGRSDDQRSCGATEQYVNLSNPKLAKSTDTPGGNYIPFNPVNVDGFVFYPQVKNAAPMNSGRHANFVKGGSRWRSDLYEEKNGANFVVQDSSLFTIFDSNGRRGDYTLSVQQNVAIIPVYYKEASLPYPGLKDVPFCAFITITETPGNLQKSILTPLLGEGFSMFSINCYDNLLAKPCSIQKYATDGGVIYPLDTSALTYAAVMFAGADDPKINFDSEGDGRFSIGGLHTAIRSGNGNFQQISQTNSVNNSGNPEAGNIIATAFNNDGAFNGMTNKAGVKTLERPSFFEQAVLPFSWASSQSGVSVVSLEVNTKKGGVQVPLTAFNPEIFKATLFSKLGFNIEQLIPYDGTSQGEFNRENYNKYLGPNQPILYKQSNMVKPFTTNAYISSFANIAATTNAAHNPMENLGTVAIGHAVTSNNISAQSDELIAENLPAKLDFAYLIVYSDIVQNPQFYGGANGQQKIPALAYVSRNYSAGDYFYSFTTNWTYTADKDYIISTIDTNITLPNGDPAPIEPNSTVIYKIRKPKALPPPPIVAPTHTHHVEHHPDHVKTDDKNEKHRQ